jgi:hypothetical protein
MVRPARPCPIAPSAGCHGNTLASLSPNSRRSGRRDASPDAASAAAPPVSQRIAVVHANAELRQWRPLQRWTGRRQDYAETHCAIAGLVSLTAPPNEPPATGPAPNSCPPSAQTAEPSDPPFFVGRCVRVRPHWVRNRGFPDRTPGCVASAPGRPRLTCSFAGKASGRVPSVRAAMVRECERDRLALGKGARAERRGRSARTRP